MKNVFEQKMIKLWDKRYLTENKTDITQRVIQVQQISLLPEHTKSISSGDILRVFAFVNAGF
jgi:hypothetical protein